MKKMDLMGSGNKQEVDKGVVSGCNIMGIDLGTTNSAVSIFTADTVPMLLPIGEHGLTTVPSCVRWDGPVVSSDSGDKGSTVIINGNRFTVGGQAYRERYRADVCYSVKRIMGSGKTVIFTKDNGSSLEVEPAEVSAAILHYLSLQVAEFYRPLSDCIITVPAYFDQRQIGDTVKAAKIAGLNCLQILKEPTSASFIYSLLGYAENGSVLIYDLGGGTFDATHMTFLRKDSVPKKMVTSLRRQYGIELDSGTGDVTEQYYSRVIGTYGDMNLGGDDIDHLFGDWVLKDQQIEFSREGREQLYLRCEAFKKLGVAGEDITIEGKKIHLDAGTLDRAVDNIFERTMKIISDVDMSEVQTIVLVGGSTKSKRLRENLKSAFPGMEISAVLDPDATVALGAGSVAKAIVNKKGLEYSDVLPMSIGVLVDEKSIDVCLQKNTSMPYSVSKLYYTMHDNQERITVHVYQGVSTKPEKCTYLGPITVEGIPPKPAGQVCVTLSFILNGQGRLKVVSQVEGVDKEEELIIDNIFSVNVEESAMASSGDTQTLTAEDDFELMVLEANSSQEACDMLKKRRSLDKDSEECWNLEQEILTKYFQ